MPRMTRDLEAKVIVETAIVERTDGFWLDVFVDRMLHHAIGSFDTEGEAQRAGTDLAEISRQLGAVDLPLREQ